MSNFSAPGAKNRRLQTRGILGLVLFACFLGGIQSVRASGITPQEDFIISPEEGQYSYPKSFPLQAGKEYPLRGETPTSYIIKYEILKGISLDIHIPKHKATYLEHTQAELQAQAEQAVQEQLAAEQRAKGLKKVGRYWVNTENGRLWNSFQQLKRLRKEVLRKEVSLNQQEARLAGYNQDLADLSKAITSQQQAQDALGAWLNSSAAKKSNSRKQYNARVQEYNRQNEKINGLVVQYKQTQASIKKAETGLVSLANSHQTKRTKYTQALARFETDLQKRLAEEGEKEQIIFLNALAQQVGSLNQEAAVDTVAIGERKEKWGGLTAVNAIINGAVRVVFLVDTGASSVVIPEKIARELGLDLGPNTPRIQSVIADGSTVESWAVTLSSVSLGKGRIRREQVSTVVIPENNKEITPLLGMSFLKHFNWHMEGDGKIVFENLKLGN